MILLLGGTGQVGTYLTERLHRDGVPYRAVVRSEDAAQRIRERGGIPVLADVARPDTVAEHLDGVSKLFLLTPGAPDQLAVQNRLVDMAGRHGVANVVKLSVYTAEEQSPCSLSRWHWHNDEYLKTSGLNWTILYPHTFMQNQPLQFGASIRQQDTMTAAVGPDKTISMVDVRDVADVAARVLATDGHDGMEYLITGPEAVSYSDCARRLSTALGRTITYNEVTAHAAYAMLTSAGVPDWLADALVALHTMYDTGDLNPITDVVETLAGHPARTFDDYAVDHVHCFN